MNRCVRVVTGGNGVGTISRLQNLPESTVVNPRQMGTVGGRLVAPRHQAIGPLRHFNGSNHMAYSEKRLIGYSRDEMYEVAANVAEYKEFVPWCRKSDVHQVNSNAMLADLEIGFQFLSEGYRSRVTHIKPSVVHSECTDDRIFRTLDTTWRFGHGKDGIDRSCTLYFDVTFEFRSALHARVTHLFFDQVVKTMVTAFLQRAEVKFGKPSFPPSDAKVLQYKT